MTASATVNLVRRAFYLDSVALMRLSQDVSALPGIVSASLMIGTESNKQLLDDADLLSEVGREAGPNDLIIAVRAQDEAAAEAALAEAETRLDRRRGEDVAAEDWNPKSLETAIDALPDANIALISVPGAFATREARKALRNGLNVMIFSDNVPIADERALKEEALERGLLLLGPDCGTAIIAGTPLAFANEVPRGRIGAVAASGTGLQEVSTLIARAGHGLSHGIGVGGRDLHSEVGGLMTLAAIDALDADSGTGHIVLISKPPAADVALRVFDRVAKSTKPFTVCFLGMDAPALPDIATFAPTLRAAAENAMGGVAIGADFDPTLVSAASPLAEGRHRVVGLYSGGTMCGEAQVIFTAAGVAVSSNAPVPGATKAAGHGGESHVLLDLGADEYTLGRPHPMIEPSVRTDALAEALKDPTVAVVLLDLVIGYGAHEDPAGQLAGFLSGLAKPRAVIVASVCGTEDDPQVYSAQVEALREAGIIVAPSNAHAAELALNLVTRSN